MRQDFQCARCGKCCRPRGYVRLREGEADHIADFLGMEALEFVRSRTRLTGDRKALSLTENEDGSCVFLSADNLCVINEVKPRQCRDFPGKWNYAGYEEDCAGARLTTSASERK